MKRITIIFNGDKVQTNAEGYEGQSCVSDTEKILEPLKPKLQDRKLKPEYNKTGVRQRASL